MNLLVVLGLAGALVVVIDDAVRDPEAMRAGRAARPGGQRNGSRPGDNCPRGAADAPLGHLRHPAIVALAVTPAVFVPGSAGAFVAPLAVAYLVGLASAMLVALLVIPALAARCSRRRPRTGGMPRLVASCNAPTTGSAAAPSPAPGWLVTAGVLAAVGALMLPLLPPRSMPRLREPDLLVTFDGSQGSRGPEMTRITAAASAELRALPGVAQVGAHVGRALQSDRSPTSTRAEIWVRIDRSADYDATVAAVQESSTAIPGLRRAVQTYLGERSGSP